MIKEKKERRLSIRLSEDDFFYLTCVSYMAGMSVSRYIRTLTDASINALKVSVKQGRVSLEDLKAIFNDQL